LKSNVVKTARLKDKLLPVM